MPFCMRVHNNYRSRESSGCGKVTRFTSLRRSFCIQVRSPRCATMTKECSRLKNCSCLPRNELCGGREKVNYCNLIQEFCKYVNTPMQREKKNARYENLRRIMSRVRISCAVYVCFSEDIVLSADIEHRFPRGVSYVASAAYLSVPHANFIT